ncbi:MAG TPA: DoxX family protein [Candidatus Methylacidiphilales bacterium]|jgi:putative oxidoreductase|nr:DoxX family protein [Candidatus Methylacidiphilales bacterium]
MNKWSPLLLSVLRIVAGLLFVEHGTQKVFGFPPSAEVHQAHAMSPMMMHLAAASGYIELIAGALILLGLFTRFAAFIASGEMAVAYFTAHVGGGIYPINNHGELAVLYCFVFFYLVFAGSGPLSLDGLIRKKA